MVLLSTGLFRLIFPCLQCFYFLAKDQRLHESGEVVWVKIMYPRKKKESENTVGNNGFVFVIFVWCCHKIIINRNHEMLFLSRDNVEECRAFSITIYPWANWIAMHSGLDSLVMYKVARVSNSMENDLSTPKTP